MEYELSGVIKRIYDEESFGSGFTKRSFVVTTVGDYPQDIPLECVKDHCRKLDNHHVGEAVTVNFNLRGREWKDRHFVNLQAWRIASRVDGAGASESAPGPSPEHEDGPSF